MLRARATISGFPGGPGLMTLYAAPDASPEDASAAQLATDRMRDAVEAFKGQLDGSGPCVFTSDAFVDKLNEVTGALEDSFSVTPWTKTSTGAGAAAPRPIAVAVTWKTTDFVNGRRVRGRTFLSPLSNATLQTDGTPAAATITAAQDFGAAWIDAGATDIYTGVWHRPVGGSGGSFHVITGYQVNDKWAVLRSRRD